MDMIECATSSGNNGVSLVYSTSSGNNGVSLVYSTSSGNNGVSPVYFGNWWHKPLKLGTRLLISMCVL